MFAVDVNGQSERGTLCYEALQQVAGDIVFSFRELKPTSRIRGDCEWACGTLHVVLPYSAEISSCV